MDLLHNIIDFFTSGFSLQEADRDSILKAIKELERVVQGLPGEAVSADSKGFDPLGKVKLANWEDLVGLIIRLAIHMGFMFVLIRLIYYPIAKRKDFLFTYFMFSISLFLLCFLLGSVKVELGFALGLFAIFGIIRYRTDAIPIKEMTYLFIIIGISVMNAMINKSISLVELLFSNSVILGITYGLEKIWLMRHESQKIVMYENIELIQMGKRNELLTDLQMRTGIKINRIEIGKIDFLRDTVMIRVYFYEDQQQDKQIDESFSGNS